MATSGDHQTTSLDLQEHDQKPIRRSSGRRKAKGGGSLSKKNKQPGRGMGVEKLERLRLQNETGLPPPFSEMNTPSAFHLHSYGDFAQMGPTRNPVSGFPGFYDPHRLLQNHDSDFLGKINGDHVMGGNVVKCYSLHCSACHKKKKINNNGAVKPEIYKCGDHRFLGLDLGDSQSIINQDSLHNFGANPNPPQALGNYGNKVEVVAVHRKGTCSSGDGGNGVLMEYDFFPSAKSAGDGDGDGGELAMTMMKGNSSMAASNCVDLSLKLSY